MTPNQTTVTLDDPARGVLRGLGTTTVAIQDYVKAIYSLAEQSGGAAVSTSALARRLGVSDGSASAMVKRLGELGLVAHRPYHGSELTERGRKLALEVIRHHRLLEAFLHEAFDMPWDEVHDEAEVLEHVLSERLEELIAEKLGHPQFDPHGDPIPARDGTIAPQAHVALCEVESGGGGVFVRVSDSEPEMLRYLTTHGIAPGMSFTVSDRQPFEGPLFVRFEGQSDDSVIGYRLAAAMRVERSAKTGVAA